MSTKIKLSVLGLAVLFASFVSMSVAFAATGASDPNNSGAYDLLKPVIDAVGKGEFALAGALGIIFATAMTRRYLPDRLGGKYVRSDVGGMCTAFLYAAAGSVATACAPGSGVAFSSTVMLSALKMGMGAVGGFVALHKLATALVATKFYQSHVPAPIKAVVALLLALVGSSASASARATNAGNEAVEKKPAPGMGEFTDVQ